MVIYGWFPTSAYVIYGCPPSKKKKKAATAMMWIDTTNTTSAKHTATVHSHCTAMPTIHYNNYPVKNYCRHRRATAAGHCCSLRRQSVVGWKHKLQMTELSYERRKQEEERRVLPSAAGGPPPSCARHRRASPLQQ